MKAFPWLISSCIAVAFFAACGKKGSSKTDTVENLETNSPVSTNSLAIGYPEGLSLASFPKGNATTLRLEDVNPEGETLKEKNLEAKKVLNGEVSDCFQNLKARAKLNLQSSETCYEFDQEMIYGWRDNDSRTFGTSDGLSRKEGSKEVCMVSFAREEMQDIEAMIDQALDRAQVMACIAKKENKEPLAKVGDKIDLKEAVNARRPRDGSGPVFDTLVLERIADKDGKPVFLTKIKTTKAAQVDEVTILHSPNSSADNSVYSGVISIKRSGGGFRTGPGAQQGNYVQALSIEYARSKESSGANKVKASVRRALFADDFENPFDDNGLVNYTALPQEADNSVVAGQSMVEFEMNQDDNTGLLSYWKNPGGNYNESARGFVFRIEKNASSGLLQGCSVSGAAWGVSIRKALSEGLTLKPDSWYHPFFNLPEGTTNAPQTGYDYGKAAGAGPGQAPAQWKKPGFADVSLAEQFVTKQMGSFVSRQCFKQDSSGDYVIDTSAGIGGTAGYELIKVNDSKFIAPPNLAAIKGKKLK